MSQSPNFFIPSSYDKSNQVGLLSCIILQGKLTEKRKELQIFLEKNGIQTRTIFTGNIMRQPVAKKFNGIVLDSLELEIKL